MEVYLSLARERQEEYPDVSSTNAPHHNPEEDREIEVLLPQGRDRLLGSPRKGGVHGVWGKQAARGCVSDSGPHYVLSYERR